MAEETQVVSADDVGTVEALLAENAVKVKLIYPHSIGDRIEIFGALWDRDGDNHYTNVSQELADLLVDGGIGEIVNG